MDFFEGIISFFSRPEVVIFGSITLIEVTPIKIKPWSWIAKKIGRLINGDVIKEVEKLRSEVADVKAEAEAIRFENGQQTAINCRVRILQFGDELRHKVCHTKENFDQTLKDITDYEQYCKDHPEFENEMTVATTEVIEDIYKKCLDPDDKEHDFL